MAAGTKLWVRSPVALPEFFFPPSQCQCFLSSTGVLEWFNWQLLVEFFPCESCYFSILRAIFLKLPTFAHLIESYSTVHGLNSCIEIIMSIPQAAHTTVTIYACCKMSFFALSKALILQSYVVSC